MHILHILQSTNIEEKTMEQAMFCKYINYFVHRKLMIF